MNAASAARPDPLALLTNTADGLMAVDPSGRIILWNRAAESPVGYSASEVPGRRCHEVLGGRDDHGNVLCHLNCHRFLASGEGTQAIARRLFVSTATVRNHTQNILAKLGVHSRLEAVALAFRSHLI